MVLAGGGSRRMGRDKLLLEVGGVTLLERVTRALAPCCGEVIVAGAASAPPGVRAVPDDRPGLGPLAGMEAGLTACRYSLVFVAAGDMPFVTPPLVGHLLMVLETRGVLAAVPEEGGRTHPLCAAYSREILPRLRESLDAGTRSAREFVGGLGRVARVREEELRAFGEPGLLLMNANSPEDLDRARELAGA